MKVLSHKQDTIKFWYNYITEDCFTYIALYIAIQYKKWNLRTESIKQMATIFTILDCPSYQKLIPRHLHDLATLPSHLLNRLEKLTFKML